MSKVLVVQVFLAGLALVYVAAVRCPRNVLYPYGTERGDGLLADGLDQHSTTDMGDDFKFYGQNYHKIYMSTHGLLFFTSYHNWWQPQSYPSYTAYAAAFWCDVDLRRGPRRGLLYRKVNVSEESDVVAQIEKDSGAIGEQITPDLVFIGTWRHTRQYDSSRDDENTFQMILAKGGNKTIMIFNYLEIEYFYYSADGNAAVQFNKGDSHNMVKYAISLQSEVQHIADYSNINVPGRIVTRVDGDIQLTPLQKYPSSVCSLNRDNGDIITFDGSDATTLSGSDMKYLLSKSYQGDEDGQLDPCKYMLKVITDGNGGVDWVSFSVGVHPQKQTKYKRNFAFERHGANIVEGRGHGLKRTIDMFPYTEHIDDNGQNLTVIVETFDGGWKVYSPTCQYTMSYNPVDDADQLRLCLGSYYDGKTLGLCQNNNNNATDDTMLCSNPPEDADPAEIAESCSCPVKDNGCNKALIEI